MNPQGTGLINVSQYTALTDKVEAASSCKELQATATKILESLNAENAAIQDQIDKLAPLAALLDPPTTPEEVIDWISGLITGLIGPLAAPALVYPSQLAARTVAIADLVNVINKKASTFSDCSITLPPP